MQRVHNRCGAIPLCRISTAFTNCPAPLTPHPSVARPDISPPRAWRLKRALGGLFYRSSRRAKSTPPHLIKIGRPPSPQNPTDTLDRDGPDTLGTMDFRKKFMLKRNSVGAFSGKEYSPSGNDEQGKWFPAKHPFRLPSWIESRFQKADVACHLGGSLRESGAFFREVLHHPRAIGAIAQTSQALARAMVQMADVSTASNIIELGSGTGAITKHIFAFKPSQARVLGIEKNSEYASLLQTRFPGLQVVNGCVSELCEHAAVHDFSAVDAVISTLPWTNFPESLQRSILSSAASLMRPRGVFLTVACVGLHLTPRGRRFRRLLEETFAQVQTSPIVWRNLPPAFLYRCAAQPAQFRP